MRARVMATFMRRRSPRKPIRPLSLARTRLIMITSRSCPWKPSTVWTVIRRRKFEGNIALDQSADILNLRFVRRNQTEVNAFVQYPFLADLFDIFLQVETSRVASSLLIRLMLSVSWSSSKWQSAVSSQTTGVSNSKMPRCLTSGADCSSSR